MVTVASDGRPHVARASVVARDGSSVVVTGPGRKTRAHVAAGSTVTVLWSPADNNDHTLVVDGRGETHDEETMVVRPTRAVLHRPAPERPAGAEPEPTGACTADCVEIALV